VVAAPVFREIAAGALGYMGVFHEGAPERRRENRDTDVDYGVRTFVAKGGGRERTGGEQAPGKVPDFDGKTIRAALRLAAERSFDLNVRGSGRAVSQRPAPGRDIPDAGGVTVVFQ